MALKLRIVSEHRRALGPSSSIVFGVSGGSIGRSADNDWVLPDPARFVSGHHARVIFRDGNWYLEDCSTNGTFINDDEAPLSKQQLTALHNGDMLRFGEYHVSVAINASGDIGPDRTDPVQGGGLGAGAVASNAPMQSQGHLDASLSTSALFRTENSGSEPLQAVGAYGQAVVLPFSGNTSVPAAAEENSDIIAARRMERLARAVRDKEFLPAGLAMAGPDQARSGLEAFCRGAGLDASSLPIDAATAMLQLAGRLMREALVGMKDLDATRTEFRHQFRLGDVRDDRDEPFRISAATDDLLRSLLAAHESRRLDPVQWLRQLFEQSKKHQEGIGWAARAGFTEFVRQLDPKELEARFASSQKRGVVGGPNSWERYSEFYRSLVDTPGKGGVPHSYSESFAESYRSVNKDR